MISVIMLTYNREKLVGRAIESILTQTHKDFEFIIIDNGSADGSGRIADTYVAKDDRIRVIHKEKGNIGSGRNTGLDVAKGDWIAFIDDDDWVEPDFLEFLLALAMENDADISVCGAMKSDSGVDTLVGIPEMTVLDAEGAVIELMWRKRFNNGFPTKLFKSSLFDGLRFPEAGRYDDIYLIYKILSRAERVASHGLPKYHVLRHSGNNSAATTKDNMITSQYLTDYRGAYRKRTLWLCEKFPKNSNLWWYFDWSFQISMVNKIISGNLVDCQQHLKEMMSELTANKDTFYSCCWILDFEKEWMKKYVYAE